MLQRPLKPSNGPCHRPVAATGRPAVWSVGWRPMATPFPPFDGSAPKQQKFSAPPEMGIDPDKRYTATMTTSMGELVIALDPIKAPKTVNNFVFLALQPLLRRRHHPPDHQRLRVPGWRPDRHRPRRPRLPVRGRAAQARPVRDRLGRDGQRRPEHQRQPVLPDLRARAAPACRPQYSLFGKIVKGLDVLEEMQNVTTGGGDKPARTSSSTPSTITEH